MEGLGSQTGSSPEGTDKGPPRCFLPSAKHYGKGQHRNQQACPGPPPQGSRWSLGVLVHMREPGGWLRRHTCPRSRPQTDVNKDTAWNPRSLTLKTCICALVCICVLTQTYTHTHRALDPTNKNTHFLSSHKTSDKITYTDYTPAPQHTFYTVYYHGADRAGPAPRGHWAMSWTSAVIKWVEPGRLLNNTPQCPGRPLTESGLAPMSPVPRKRPFYTEKRGLFEELKINFKKGHGGSTGDSTGCLLGTPLRGPEPSSRSSPGQSLSPPG